MMEKKMNGFYCLYSSGDVIWKPYWPEYSKSVEHVWPVCSSRIGPWQIILEALALGAKTSRVQELSLKWDFDLKAFIDMLAHAKPTERMKEGAPIFLKKILGFDPSQFKNILRTYSGRSSITT